MKTAMMAVAMTALLVMPAAHAQEWRSQQNGAQSGAAEPPGGAYRGFQDSRDLPQQQAQAREPSAVSPADPGTLRRFNSNSGYGPEVQFDIDRRQAAERQRELQQQQELQRQQDQWR